ncbi:DNA cytosine methyltransferase [Catelliglobosispora koreensis]|uniref:DNA cytosine methyltransferase n=1 Tax=Catelliglobosispora koreensis TaxID=129052 RepID=UPI000368ED07|nr:DNA cytosine methyltransferase [Catelliglobosispora koreensis]
MSANRWTSIELFTGGGGLALGMSEAGFEHLLAVENHPRACASLLLNKAVPADAGHLPLGRWPLKACGIQEVDFSHWHGEVDVIAGGVPCQPWSIGGSSKRDAATDFDRMSEKIGDERNLWPELFKVIQKTRPKAVIAENVAGLMRPSFAPYFEYILRELRAPFEKRVSGEEWYDHDKRLQDALRRKNSDPTERYVVKAVLLNAADYGVPQYRKRVFVVAYRADLGLEEWAAPDPTHSEAALLHDQATGAYWERHNIKRRRGFGIEAAIEDQRQPWFTVRDAISGYSNGGKPLPEPKLNREETPGFLHHVGWPGARVYRGHQPSDPDRPSKTVKAGVHGVAGGEGAIKFPGKPVRYLTVREVARLMTFPDDWRLDGSRGPQMRQLGNAVPVRLAEAVAKSVADDLAKAAGTAAEVSLLSETKGKTRSRKK